MKNTEFRIGGVPVDDAEQKHGQKHGQKDEQGEPKENAPDATRPEAPRTLEEKVIEALRQVYDPEIPVNIYELGLVYGIDIDAARKVVIKMTLTSPACPVAESLPLEVRAGVGRIPEVSECEVELVWEPQWGPDKMSDEAKLKLGML